MKSAPRLPLRAFHEGVDDVGHEGLADADVAVRVFVARGPLFLAREGRVDEGDGGQRPGAAAVVVLLHLARAGDPGRAPERRDGDVGVEVTVRDARRGERGEDRRVGEAAGVFGGLEGEGVVLHPVGLGRVHVLAVRVGRGEQRAEEAVEGGEFLRRRGDEGQVLLGVVADREDVVFARAQEAVHVAAVELVPPPFPGVVGIGVRAALPVGGEPVRFEGLAGGVGVGEARLAAVGPGQPTEVMVEGAVLHHQHDDRVERHVLRAGDIDPVGGRRLREDRVGTEDARHPHRQAAGQGGALEELAPAHEAVGVDRLEALGRLGVAVIVRVPPVAAV